MAWAERMEKKLFLEMISMSSGCSIKKKKKDALLYQSLYL